MSFQSRVVKVNLLHVIWLVSSHNGRGGGAAPASLDYLSILNNYSVCEPNSREMSPHPLSSLIHQHA